jgi:hypothetical protein
MNTPNYIKLDACKQIEEMYNRLAEWYADVNTSDAALEAEASIYRTVLLECREYGIGGVLVNGTFRTTEI